VRAHWRARIDFFRMELSTIRGSMTSCAVFITGLRSYRVSPSPASTKASVIRAETCRACAERFVSKPQECLGTIEPFESVVFDGYPPPSTRPIAPNGITKGFGASPSSAGVENVWTPYTVGSAIRRTVGCVYQAAA
jgi:hypothetical protein